MTSLLDRDGLNEPISDRVYELLLAQIYSGQLSPGTEINEAAIARQFGVSRGPVREAVRRLQGIQLITREPYLRARVIELSAESALELFQMRMGLEGVACYLAAERMTNEEIDALLRDTELDYERRLQGIPAPEGRHFDFHERIVRASGNSRIIYALCEDLYHVLRIYRRHSGSEQERQQGAFEEHRQIVLAMRNREPHLAESLMRSHINRAAEHIKQQLNI